MMGTFPDRAGWLESRTLGRVVRTVTCIDCTVPSKTAASQGKLLQKWHPKTCLFAWLLFFNGIQDIELTAMARNAVVACGC